MKRFLLLLTAAFVPLTAFAQSDKATRTLYLVRHGMYDSVKGADSKVANPLNPLGREQAELVAARLAELPVKFDTIVSSEFTRARETGDIIAAKLGMKCQRDPLLNESIPAYQPVDPRMIPLPGAEAQFDAAWASFSKPATGESRAEVLACHGNVIRWFVCKTLGIDPSHYVRMDIANASLTVIVIQANGSCSLMTYNDVSHVPLEKQTWFALGNKPLWRAPAATPNK